MTFASRRHYRVRDTESELRRVKVPFYAFVLTGLFLCSCGHHEPPVPDLSKYSSLHLILAGPVSANSTLRLYQCLSYERWDFVDTVSGEILSYGEISSLIVQDQINNSELTNIDRDETEKRVFSFDKGQSLEVISSAVKGATDRIDIKSYHHGRVLVMGANPDTSLMKLPLKITKRKSHSIDSALDWLTVQIDRAHGGVSMKRNEFMAFFGNAEHYALIAHYYWKFSPDDGIENVEQFLVKIMNDSPMPIRLSIVRLPPETNNATGSPIANYRITYMPGSGSNWAIDKNVAAALDARQRQ